MHSRIFIVAIATAIALPIAARAQIDASGVTRAQVREELVQLERAGYRPGRPNDPHYPDDLLAAEARIRTAVRVDPYAVNAVGSATDGQSHSGSRIDASGVQNALFTHH